MATESFKHIILHTHNSDGKPKDTPAPIRARDMDYVIEDVEDAKAGCAQLTKENRGHKFAVYTLVPR